MKKILALAIAAALASPMALADNPPRNVGDVTYLGNIVANSPMWQWTVNDYPGGRLDAKPSEVVEANGTYTYPLHGQAFIAASGYLPSVVGINLASGIFSTLGTRDITSLTDQNGAAPADITDAQKGAVTFTIAASGYDLSGQAVEGKLLLKATEVRGFRTAITAAAGSSEGIRAKRLYVFGKTAPLFTRGADSCFAGTGKFTSTAEVVNGDADSPAPGSQTPAAFAEFVTALQKADTTGSAPPYSSITGSNVNETIAWASSCVTPTQNANATNGDDTVKLDYIAAAHVMELTPIELQFTNPLSGAWNSTLTVTAYTM
ncbi:hypothetical protein AB7W40_13810 [Providencia rettgeri]